jgi:hypothetical protein
MTLDEIQIMWDQDSQIDPDNLHLESLKIPSLHAKYFKVYNNLKLLYKKNLYDYNLMKRERYEFYSGKAEKEVYVEEPFPFKVRDKESMNRYLESDKKLNDYKLKCEYYETMMNYIEDILKTILNRTYQIKNAIEFQKFTSGFS